MINNEMTFSYLLLPTHLSTVHVGVRRLVCVRFCLSFCYLFRCLQVCVSWSITDMMDKMYPNLITLQHFASFVGVNVILFSVPNTAASHVSVSHVG